MKQFNKENLYNIHKIDPKLVNMFNETLKKYKPESQEAYFELITSIDNDYNKLVKIPYTNYLYEMSKKPYDDFEALQEYHNAMLSVNEENEYGDLYYLLKDNRDVEDFTENYMGENEIYYTEELWNMIDDDLRTNGIDSELRYLIPSVEGNSAEYSKINAYGNDVDSYEDMEEVFKEVYEDSYDIIDRYYFENLGEEPTPPSPGTAIIEEPEM